MRALYDDDATADAARSDEGSDAEVVARHVRTAARRRLVVPTAIVLAVAGGSVAEARHSLEHGGASLRAVLAAHLASSMRTEGPR